MGGNYSWRRQTSTTICESEHILLPIEEGDITLPNTYDSTGTVTRNRFSKVATVSRRTSPTTTSRKNNEQIVRDFRFIFWASIVLDRTNFPSSRKGNSFQANEKTKFFSLMFGPILSRYLLAASPWVSSGEDWRDKTKKCLLDCFSKFASIRSWLLVAECSIHHIHRSRVISSHWESVCMYMIYFCWLFCKLLSQLRSCLVCYYDCNLDIRFRMEDLCPCPLQYTDTLLGPSNGTPTIIL